jgi:hypothetical protein
MVLLITELGLMMRLQEIVNENKELEKKPINKKSEEE